MRLTFVFLAVSALQIGLNSSKPGTLGFTSPREIAHLTTPETEATEEIKDSQKEKVSEVDRDLGDASTDDATASSFETSHSSTDQTTSMYENVSGTLPNVSLGSLTRKGGVSYCQRVIAVAGIFFGIIAVFGLTGNCISIAVLSRMSSNMATSLLLSVLAFWDSVFLVMMVLLLTIPPTSAVYFPIPNSKGPFAYMLLYGSSIFTVSNLSATWTIVLLTCHRYIAVCRPHHAARLCRSSVAKWQLFTVHIGTIAFTMPLFFDSKIVEDNSGDTTNYLWKFTTFGADPLYQILYRIVLYLVLAYAIPLTSLAVLAVLLIRAVRQANKRRAEMTSGKSVAREDVTKILIAVVLVFLACQIWNPILRIISAATLQRAGCGNAYFAVQLIAALMSTINSSANFLIYIWFGAAFRKTMKAMLCPCLAANSQPTIDQNTKPSNKSDKKPNEIRD